jgi:hypothetical protein
MNQNESNLKNVLLKHYLKPITKLVEKDGLLFADMKREINTFVEANKDVETDEYLQRARNKFGYLIELADRSILLDKIASIEGKIKYFFILSLISIFIAVIAGLSTIK